MSLLVSSTLSYLIKDVQSTLISLLIGSVTLIALHLINFYFVTVKKYPKGPTPLPIIGNILMFKKRMSHDVMKDICTKYGQVSTVWMGSKPMIILGTNDVINEAFKEKKNDFAGRPDFNFRELTLVTATSDDVIFQDWGRPWEVLRRVAHSAARKFAVNPSLPLLEVQVIDEVVELILSKEGPNKPFKLNDYVYLMVYSIIASTATGKSYSINDPEFLALKKANDDGLELQTEFVLLEFLPVLMYLPWYRKKWQEGIRLSKVQLDWVRNVFSNHLETYQAGNIRDFCDALIFAKKEAEVADGEASVHLNNENLMNVILNLFQAGTETTRMVLMWAFLIMAKYQNVQDKLRSEIDEVIGDDVPNNDHRLKCHYVQAFISEVLRFAPIVPTGLPHKSIVDGNVDGHEIKKGTTVVPLIHAQLHDESIWKDPEEFRPERFLDPSTGVHTTRVNTAFGPFGVGRRACLGEKLATINLFIEITRFIQKLKGFKIILKPEDEQREDLLLPDPKQPASFAAKDYEIMIVNL